MRKELLVPAVGTLLIAMALITSAATGMINVAHAQKQQQQAPNGGNTANGGNNTGPIVGKIPNTAQFPAAKTNASGNTTTSSTQQNHK